MDNQTIDIRLANTILFQELRKKCVDSGDHDIIHRVNEIYEFSKSKLKCVIKNLPEFTLHDEEHISNMLRIAGKIIPSETLCELSIPDIMMIIISVCLHDIGMAPEEINIKAWKHQVNSEELNDMQIMEKKEFERYRSTQYNLLDEIESLNNRSEYGKAQLLEDYIVSSYIRITHSKRTKRVIADNWDGKIRFRNTDLTPHLAQICYSHTENYTSILNMESLCLCDDDIYLCIPFVAVILRLSDIIDFDPKRTPKVLFSHLAVSNPVSLQEWNKHLSINAWTINSKKLVYSAQCSHPAIEASIKEFCDLIDDELRNCTLILSNLNGDDFEIDTSKYKIPLPARVERSKIQANRDIVTGKSIYKYNDTKFTLSKTQVIDLLMGTKLYGKPEVALRELIQNSLDACMLRSKLSENWNEHYTPQIVISLSNDSGYDYLEVADNGIGMNQYIIDNYYSNIGCSYYKSNDFYELMAGLNSSFTPISRFGIGVLACFMVSDHLEVHTRRVVDQYQCDEAIKLAIEGYDSLFVITDGELKAPGTATKLRLRKKNPWELMKESAFVDSIKKIVPKPPFDIVIRTNSGEFTHGVSTSNPLDLTPLLDYTWNDKDNVEIIRIEFDNTEFGFKGVCDVAALVSKSKFVEKINITSKDVEVEGENFTLTMDVRYGANCIERHSDGISVNDDGEVEFSTSYFKRFQSKSALSIHGIEVPCVLFPDYSTYGEKALLNFPLPVAFRLDIYGVSDLNLNSARNRIIYDEKWLNFEFELYTTIINSLKETLSNRKWKQLKYVIKKHTESEMMIDTLG